MGALAGSTRGYIARDEEGRALVTGLLQSIRAKTKRDPVKTAAELEERIAEYFQICIDEGTIPTVEEMSNYCGLSRMALWNWEHGIKLDSIGHDAQRVVQQAKQTLAAFDAQLAINGAIPVALYTFRAKNFYGMRDAQSVEIGTQPPDEMSEDDIAKRYISDGRTVEGECEVGDPE